MRDIVLIGLIIGLLPLCFVRPWIGALTWTWLGLMNPHRQTWTIAQDLPFAQMVALALIGGIFMSQDKKAVPWSRELVLLVAVITLFTFTSFFAWVPDAAWKQWDKVIKIVFMAFMVSMVIRGHYKVHALILVAALSIGFYGFKGGIFTITTGGNHRIYGPEASFIGDNNSIGLAMIMVLPLFMALLRQEHRKWIRNAYIATIGLTMLAIVFTYSRGALVGLVAILPFMFGRSKRKFLLLLLVIPAAIWFVNFAPSKLFDRAETIGTYTEDQSAMQRLQAWQVAFNVAKERPLTGAGFDFYYISDAKWLSYSPEKYLKWGTSARAAHSNWFQVLGQHGFIGLGLFLAMLIGSILTLRNVEKECAGDESRRWIANYAWAVRIGLIGYCVSGTFLSLAYFDMMYLFVILSALLRREMLEPTRDEVPSGKLFELLGPGNIGRPPEPEILPAPAPRYGRVQR